MADVAAEKGVGERGLIDAMMAYHNDALNARVQSGFLSQAQANSIRQAQEAPVRYMLEQKGFGGRGMMGGYSMSPGMVGRGGMKGPGMMGGGFGGWSWNR